MLVITPTYMRGHLLESSAFWRMHSKIGLMMSLKTSQWRRSCCWSTIGYYLQQQQKKNFIVVVTVGKIINSAAAVHQLLDFSNRNQIRKRPWYNNASCFYVCLLPPTVSAWWWISVDYFLWCFSRKIVDTCASDHCVFSGFKSNTDLEWQPAFIGHLSTSRCHFWEFWPLALQKWS